MWAERTRNPLDNAALFNKSTLGVKVIHIFRPVFNSWISELGIFLDKQFNATRVKVCNIVFRCGTALDEMKICSLIYNDQGMLKLSGSRCIQTEIGLQGNFHRNARRYINKGSAWPDCAVKGGKFVVIWLYQLHKMSTDHICVFPVHSTFQVCVNNSLGCYLCFYIVVYQLGIVLGANAS